MMMAPQMAGAEPPQIYDRFVKRGLLISLLLFGGFIAWMVFAELDEGVAAPGTISVESRRKTVQHLEGGIIAEVFVREGQRVEMDEVLFTLDTTQSQSRRNQAFAQLLTTWARMDRLRAERQGFGAIEFRPALTNLGNALVRDIRDVQENLFDARKSQILGQVEILEQRIEQLNDQTDGLEAQRAAARAQVRLIQEEIDRYNQVAELQATDVRSRLQRERELAQIEGQLGQLDAEEAQTGVFVGETRIEILQVERTFQEAVAAEITEAQDRALSLEDEVRGLDDVLARTDIRANATGNVLNLGFSSVGGVIPPGQAILDIVPEGDLLVVEAQATLNDIDNIDIGQSVRITITALNQRTTPELQGAVVSVAADAVQDPNTGIPFYPVRIAFSQGELEKLGEQSLRPGMGAQVFIRGGTRTPLDYFLTPITDTLRNSLNEI